MGLTMLRMLLLPVFVWALFSYGKDRAEFSAWIPIGIFALMALTDKLDGYLARRLQQTSRLGAILDPVADKLLVACSVFLLGLESVAAPGYAIPSWVVIAVYGKDVVTVVGIVVMLAIVGSVSISPRPLGKASTLLQLSMILAVLIAPQMPASADAFWRQLVHVLWWAVALVAAAACLDYVFQGWREFANCRRSTPKAKDSTKAAPTATTPTS
jgi:CDP-diacylglycerol--glycerol-3-phosphate 3-phosphatidyltransferase